MTIATDYLSRTGETIAQACRRLHAAGWGIQRAAKRLGYTSSTDLRKYLRSHEFTCPWQKDLAYARGGKPPTKIVQGEVDQYHLLLKLGLSAQSAAAEVGHSSSALQRAARRLKNNQSATSKNISAVYKTSVQSEPSRT